MEYDKDDSIDFDALMALFDDNNVEGDQKIKEDMRINNILFSHDYAPWNCDKAIGREQVEKILQDCKDSLSLVK